MDLLGLFILIIFILGFIQLIGFTLKAGFFLLGIILKLVFILALTVIGIIFFPSVFVLGFFLLPLLLFIAGAIFFFKLIF